MNKKLVAVAIAGVLAAPLAQAQTANVTLYGRLNLDVTAICQSAQQTRRTPDVGSRQPNQYRVSSNSSRFGLRGTESLGGGLNAIFQVENSLTAGQQRRHARRSRHVHRPAGRVGYVQDGLLPRCRTTTSTATSGVATRPWRRASWPRRRSGRRASRPRRPAVRRPDRQLDPLGFADRGRASSARLSTASAAAPTGTRRHADVEFRRHRAAPSSTRTARSTSALAFQYNEQVTRGRPQRQRVLGRGRVPVPEGQGRRRLRASGLRLLGLASGPSSSVDTAPDCRCSTTITDHVGTTNLTRNMYGVDLTVDIGPGQFYADWSYGDERQGQRPDRRPRRRPGEGRQTRRRTSGKSATRIRCRSARACTPATRRSSTSSPRRTTSASTRTRSRSAASRRAS